MPLALALVCADEGISRFDTQILPHTAENRVVNERYVERLLKFLLWARGGCLPTRRSRR